MPSLPLCAGTLSPEWAANSTNLRYLLLGNNSLTGDIPPGWSSLAANAQEVDLSLNNLRGALGPDWNVSTRNANNTWSLSAFQLR